MSAITEASLLAAWETALPRPRRDRALVLAGLVTKPGEECLEDLPLGEVDALLLDLHECCFGSILECLVSCPACEEELEAAVEVADLRFPAAQEHSRRVSVDGKTLVVRALTSRDLSVAQDRSMLVRRCVIEGQLDDHDPELVENLLDELDPKASPEVELDCPACHRIWMAAFDVADFVWQEVDRYARRTLHEVHVLAMAYGWREPDVLALTRLRRDYYLQAAGV